MLLGDAGYGHMPLDSVADLETIARTLQGLGPAWVLVKGGHAPFRKNYSVAKTDQEKQIIVDVLYGQGGSMRIETGYQDSRNTHGTGCSLACKSPNFSMQLTIFSLSDDIQLRLHPISPRAWKCPLLSRLRADTSKLASGPPQALAQGMGL